MSVSRRLLLMSGPFAALAGCSAQHKTAFFTFSGALYTDIVKIATLLEAAVKKSAVDIEGAVADMLPYVVPCCRLAVAMDRLLAQLVSSGTLKGSDSKIGTAQRALDGIAQNAVVAQTAQTGQLPNASDATTIITGIIQVAGLVIDLTGGKVAPVAAARSA